MRPYESVYQPDVMALHRLALPEALPGPWEEDLHTIETAYAPPHGCFLLLFQDIRLVGMGAFRPAAQDKTAELRRMRILPSFQHKGLGTRVLHALEHKAQEAGYDHSVLETATTNTCARRFYENQGYVFYRMEVIGGLDCVWYKKELKNKGITA